MEILLFFISIMIYFIPSYVALYNEHKNLTGIVLLNIFLGWTFVGWVGSLIWAVLKQEK